jgi:TetR/AcrR family transcriptional regulator, cholesterol catabolism regulator
MSSAAREAVPVLGRRERKKRQVEAGIQRAALELFREKGYEATTVEEIAERADVAKGTFFNYFARKDVLLKALAEDMAGELLDELGPPESWEGPVREQVQRVFLRIAELVGRDPDLARVMMIENLRGFWLRAEPDPLEEEFDEVIRGALKRGAERGEIRGDVEVAWAAKLVKGAHFVTMADWLRRDAPAGEYEAALVGQFEIIFRGLAVPAEDGKGGSW